MLRIEMDDPTLTGPPFPLPAAPPFDDARESEPSTEQDEDDPHWLAAAHAASDRKAENLRVLDLRGVTSFTDHFVLCTGNNPRQVQAIADAVQQALKARGERPLSVEGYENAEWVLADYGDYIVHIFSPGARDYYQLERLWRDAKDVPVPAAAETA